MAFHTVTLRMRHTAALRHSQVSAHLVHIYFAISVLFPLCYAAVSGPRVARTYHYLRTLLVDASAGCWRGLRAHA
jgi:hypothetical protein